MGESGGKKERREEKITGKPSSTLLNFVKFF
jgi:hypothetical protein